MQNKTITRILTAITSVGTMAIVVVVSATGGYTILQATGLLVALAVIVTTTLLDGMITGASIALSKDSKDLGDLFD